MAVQAPAVIADEDKRMTTDCDVEDRDCLDAEVEIHEYPKAALKAPILFYGVQVRGNF
jgi:hypothetical protein